MAYDYANPYQGANPYDQQRKQAVDAAQGAGQQATDAMTRRMAAMGNLNSGSYTKGLQEIGKNTQGATESALGGINANELQSSIGAQEAQKAREFQGGEFQQQLGQQASQFSQELPLKSRQLDLEASQQQLDKQANDINADLARQQLDRTGGLFGGGGFLGTGLGGGSGGTGSLGSAIGIGAGSALGGLPGAAIGAITGGFHF